MRGQTVDSNPHEFLHGPECGRWSQQVPPASDQPANPRGGPEGRRLLTARPSGSLKTKFPIVSGPQKRRPELFDRRVAAMRSSRRKNCARITTPNGIAKNNVSLLEINPEIKTDSCTCALRCEQDGQKNLDMRDFSYSRFVHRHIIRSLLSRIELRWKPR